jgi:hypothetical protein
MNQILDALRLELEPFFERPICRYAPHVVLQAIAELWLTHVIEQVADGAVRVDYALIDGRIGGWPARRPAELLRRSAIRPPDPLKNRLVINRESRSTGEPRVSIAGTAPCLPVCDTMGVSHSPFQIPCTSMHQDLSCIAIEGADRLPRQNSNEEVQLEAPGPNRT